MNKFVIKTTKEYKYDDEGLLIEEVITQEEYTEEVQEVTTKTFGDCLDKDWKVATGVPPTYEKETEEEPDEPSGVGNSIGSMVINVDNKTITDILNEVKTQLKRDMYKKGL